MTSDNKRRYLDHFSKRNCSLSQKISSQYHRIRHLLCYLLISLIFIKIGDDVYIRVYMFRTYTAVGH